MAWGLGNVGSSGINLKIVTGAVEPTTVQNNLIWINTTTPMSSYVIAGTEPINPTEGMIWLLPLDYANTFAEFGNKNKIYIYLSGCMQYISGTWQNKSMQIYQNGWQKTTLIVVENGALNTVQTGDWIAQAIPYGATAPAIPKVSSVDGTLQINPGDFSSGTYRSGIKINMSAYKELEIAASQIDADIAGWGRIIINPSEISNSQSISNSYGAAADIGATNDVKTTILDLSKVDGNQYIYLSAYHRTLKVKSLILRSTYDEKRDMKIALNSLGVNV